MKFRKFYAILLGFVFTAALNLTPVYAEEQHPMQHGTSSGAAVSEEVDTTTNADDDMSTEIFMYIPPDPKVKDVPKMGDAGLDVNVLCLFTLGVGVAYLGCRYYACK